MNATITMFLLAGDKFKFEMYLRQARFTYSACEYKNLKKREIYDISIKMN